MGAGEFFQKPSAPLSSLTAFGKTLISAGSISLDSTFKCVYVCGPAVYFFLANGDLQQRE
jgi:hypothetical protein